MTLRQGNDLHARYIETGFQNGAFFSKMNADAARWIWLRICINVYAGAPDYIYKGAGTNFNESGSNKKQKA